MDAHFFRIAAEELIDLLEGARLEKIHGPEPGLLVFTLFAGGRKRRLLFRHERQAPRLFFSGHVPANPARPPEAVMRLRKYCAGRRLGRGTGDFAARRLAFPLPGEQDAARWLLLDMAEGAFVRENLPEGFAAPPPWPDAALVEALCGAPWKKGERDGPWREYAVLTPFLRETLAALPPLEGRALLVDLEAGGGDVFLYGDKDGRPALCSAWPLPESVGARRGLDPRPLVPLREKDPVFLPWLAAAGEAAELLPAFPALACSALADERALFADLGGRARKEESQPLRRAQKKLERLLTKLDREEQRLRGMLALREDAIALQALLWSFGADERRESFLAPGEREGTERLVRLDPLLTVRENMARMFKESSRGARGLAMLAERRAALGAGAPSTGEAQGAEPEIAAARQSAEPLSESVTHLQPPGPGARLQPPGSGARLQPPGPGVTEYPGVARFLSSDGFVLLRGKNARGNHSLLKIGSPHDIWLHAEDGPSAHLVIRRSHPAEEVPERTLREAALLVAEKSRFGRDSAAVIMTALLRHVHAVKGAPPGTVRVEKRSGNLRVAPQDLEDAGGQSEADDSL